MITLYADTPWISPYVFSSFVALREKGVAFEVVDVDLDRGEQHAPQFRAASLTARVPMLCDGDLTLSESSAIAEYLEEAYPPPRHSRLFPAAAGDRARARQMMAWLRSDLLALREERPT